MEAVLGTWALIQIVFDIFIAVGLFTVVMRMNRQPKDDPRLSRGLQLLQSKIAVLEDLSDRTEVQVNQLTAILEQKAREVQAKVQLAEQHVHELRVSMERSLEVAKIFQDKIPHQEIIERQSTMKYVQAARLAHQGLSVDEIASQVDLPKGEIEFIAKVNRDQLMFNEEQLPMWAKDGTAAATDAPAIGGTTGMPNGAGQALAQAFPSSDITLGGPTATPAPTAPSAAELQLAEHQRMIENLSRIQFEMQSLDMQLAKESAGRDLSAAFDVPKPQTQTLAKLGEEFRKACEQAESRNTGSSLFPPLEQLSAIIPQALGGIEAALMQAAQQSPAAQTVSTPSMQDPMLARAVAQQKVQAALRSSAPQAQQAPAREASADLAAARAMAKETTAPQPKHVISTRGANGAEPVVKKVQFPRLDTKP
jgi:hypothetical protein